MSKPISDAQIYGLMWARSTTYGMFSELHAPPMLLHATDGREVRLLRTAFERLGLLGLGRRGLLRDCGNGLWEITDAGRTELQRAPITRRIAAMADATAEDNRKVQFEHDEIIDRQST